MAINQLYPLFKNDCCATWRYLRRAEKKKLAKKLLQRHLWKWYALLALIIAISITISIKHNAIIHYLHPIAHKIRQWPGGFLIWVAALVVVSFPPLVGHEIIGLVVGLIYGLGKGFFILAAGTFLGELATWFAFRSCCTKRAAKFEAKSIYYSALTQLIREKSFAFVLILRFSAIPGHIVTALSSSAGANFFSYCAAAFLTLPKQLALVYLGTAFESKNHKTKVISIVTLFATIIGTGVAAVYVYYQMRLYLIQNGHSEWPKARGSQTSDLPMTNQDVDTDSDSKAEMEAVGGPTLVSIAEVRDEWSQRGGGGPRRPFLHSTSSFTIPPNSRGIARAKSLPSSHADEIKEYLARQSSSGSPQLTPGNASFDSRGDDDPIQDPDSSMTTTANSEVPVLRLSFSGTPDDSHTPSRASLQLADRLDLDYERGTASMDLWRPESMTLGTSGKQAKWRAERQRQSHVASGREIAADADAYARAHGARRPDHGRRRGESSAALLPRPADDETGSVSEGER